MRKRRGGSEQVRIALGKRTRVDPSTLMRCLLLRVARRDLRPQKCPARAVGRDAPGRPEGGDKGEAASRRLVLAQMQQMSVDVQLLLTPAQATRRFPVKVIVVI
jgi:hypothetical protein